MILIFILSNDSFNITKNRSSQFYRIFYSQDFIYTIYRSISIITVAADDRIMLLIGRV